MEHGEHYRLTFNTLREADVDFFHLICYWDDAENKSTVHSPTHPRVRVKLYETYKADMTPFVCVLIMLHAFGELDNFPWITFLNLYVPAIETFMDFCILLFVHYIILPREK